MKFPIKCVVTGKKDLVRTNLKNTEDIKIIIMINKRKLAEEYFIDDMTNGEMEIGTTTKQPKRKKEEGEISVRNSEKTK